MTTAASVSRRTGTSRAAAVSAALHKTGLHPLPAGSPRTREGVRVTWGYGSVSISVGIDAPAAMLAIKDELWLRLEELGYTVEPNPHTDSIVYARKADW